jgi:hypothetical protein
MEGLYFRKSNKNQKLSLHVKCSWKRVCICQKTADFEIIIQLAVDFYRCNNCINLKYGSPLELHNVLKNHYTQTMYLLSRIKFKKIPKILLYEIGKITKNPKSSNTCESARSAIRTFCLYCIRYQKERVNRDVRRKICELIWMDKIKFLQ